MPVARESSIDVAGLLDGALDLLWFLSLKTSKTTDPQRRNPHHPAADRALFELEIVAGAGMLRGLRV